MTAQSEVAGNPNYIKVHNHGFVGLVDHLGSDQSIERAARVSYQQGTRPISDTRALLRYLMNHKHTSPFEMAECVFHIRLPIFVMRQLIRHRTANVNEVSGRYSELPAEFYVPAPEDVCPQSKTNKQGRTSEPHEAAEIFSRWFQWSYDRSAAEYHDLLEADIARETARFVLPVATYTECYWKMDLHNLFHFLKLRMDRHAQKEMRDFAKAIHDLAAPLFPLSFEAWNDYSLEAVTFSKYEMVLLRRLWDLVRDENLDDVMWGDCPSQLTTREIAEFKQKMTTPTQQ